MQVEIHNLEATIKTLENLDKEKAKWVIGETTERMYENTRFFARPHHKTGMLERNIRHKIKDNAGIVWIDDENMLVDWRGKKINYAKFVLKGTRPHTIKPKTKKSLRFSYKNLDEFVFRKGVHHPGYKGDDFMKKAINKTLSQLDEIVKGV
jgi:hypothetical protein